MSRNKNRNRNQRKGLATNQFPAGAPISGFPVNGANAPGAGGWGVGSPGSQPATGQQPTVNPFIIPKQSGLTITSNTFPNNYYVEWTPSSWRAVCDQAIKMGYCLGYSTLTSWTFECSPFVQGLFNRLGRALDKIPFIFKDKNGDEIPAWTQELCVKPWEMALRREILFSFFWGFSGINFDPYAQEIYKYPMQDIDPINRLLRSSTFAFYDGTKFEENDNLLFIQPSTNYESFLGWMQPITRSFIQMNTSKNSWVSAGRRLAFPVQTVGYPQQDGGINPATALDNNPYRLQAESIAANIDPTQGLVYPYTINSKGEIVKSILMEFEQPGTAANMHKIFQEFNADEKAEIQEMIFGRSLTNTNNKSGNRALAEIEEEVIDKVAEALSAFVIGVLNGSFKNKIAKFYTNFPKDGLFATNIRKQMTADDMVKLSAVVVENGKRLTGKFFEANGVPSDFIEDGPVMDPKIGNDGEDVKADLSSALKKKAHLR